MVGKKPVGRKSNTLMDRAEINNSPGFILLDTRILKMLVERYLPNELALKGTYQINSNITMLNLPEPTDPPFGIINYDIKIIGYRKAAVDQTDDLPSFLVQLELEGKFSVGDFAIEDMEQVGAFLPTLVHQVHALAIEKMRGAISDMGYAGARPPLGITSLVTTIEKILPAKKKRVARPKTTAS